MSPRSSQLGIGLSVLALLAFLLQTLHFAAVVHEQGEDGRLYHVHGGGGVLCHHHRGEGDEDSPRDDEPEEGDGSCPLHPPGLDRCGGEEPAFACSIPKASRVGQAVPSDPIAGPPPLSLAPKQSPPRLRCA